MNDAYTALTALGPGTIVFKETLKGYYSAVGYDASGQTVAEAMPLYYDKIDLRDNREKVVIDCSSKKLEFHYKLTRPLYNREGNVIGYEDYWSPTAIDHFHLNNDVKYFLVSSCTASISSSTKYVAPEGE